MALSYINDDFMVQLHGPHADKAGSVKQPVHLNMAACQLKLKDWQGAVWNCSQVQHTLAESDDKMSARHQEMSAQLRGPHAARAASV